MTTSKAYRWHGPGTGNMKLESLTIPEPGPHQVLIEVLACGLCHSDCHIIHGSETQSDAVKLRPITMGHEVAGKVLRLGPGVTEARVGDRVAVALGGHPDRPPNVIGLTMDGGYAEYAIAAAEMLVAVPDSVSDEQAAVVTDSLTTAYHAVVGTAEVQPGDTVAIVGLGGLGAVGLRVACLQGATVYGFDIDERKLESARAQQGVKACHVKLDDVNDTVVFDKIIDFVGVDATLRTALKHIRYRGRLVMVGLGAAEVTLPVFGIIYNKVEIHGSLGGSKDDMHAVMKLISEGKLRPELEEIPFEKVNEGLSRLECGKVVGRLFTRPGKGRTVES